MLPDKNFSIFGFSSGHFLECKACETLSTENYYCATVPYGHSITFSDLIVFEHICLMYEVNVAKR